MKTRDRERLVYLVNDLNDAKQAYDNVVVPERPDLERVLATGERLRSAAEDIHSFLVSKLTSVGGL